eukprot:842036-Ditylum_brightwellii.AAC.1
MGVKELIRIQNYSMLSYPYLVSLREKEESTGIFNLLQQKQHLVSNQESGPTACLSCLNWREEQKDLSYAMVRAIYLVWATHPHLIIPDLDILEEYGIARSLRRRLLSRATDQN